LPAGMDKVQVMPVITLATKVQIDIMKAIARRIESNVQSAYVPNFLPRPILHIKAIDTRRHISSLTFSDAVKEYGGLIKGSNLAPAYKRAGGNFRDQMRQHFVVLEDPEVKGSRFSVPPPKANFSEPPPEVNRVKGKKRGNDDLESDDVEASGSGSGKRSK